MGTDSRRSKVRVLARAGARLLPRAALARIAEFRFGYSGPAHRFDVAFDPSAAEPVLTVDGSLRVRLTPDFAEHIAYHFVENSESTHEMRAFIAVAGELAPGALLLDVGAHKGLFALIHCAVNPAHRAVLFEPSASLADQARELIALNGFGERAVVVRSGVSARERDFYVGEDGAGFAVISDTPQAGADAVPFVTIDAECRRRGITPAVIKVDVEGAEADVLLGAEDTLRSSKPILFLELHLDALEQRGERLDALVDRLRAAGYRFESVDGRRRSRAALVNSVRGLQRIIAR
jgi:FkbM family methyltransferase